MPAVIYGPDFGSQPIAVKKTDFLKVLRQAGETQPVNLQLGFKNIQVLVHDIQRSPVLDEVIHVDFYHVSGKRPIRSKVPVVLRGESPVVKNHQGLLVIHIRELEVEAKLQDLPAEITGDLGRLKEVHDELTVAELDIPSKAKVVDHGPQDVVATVVPAREEEEEELSAEEELAETEEPQAEQEGETKPPAQERTAKDETQ